MHKFYRRTIAFLLLIAMLASVLPVAFTAEAEPIETTTEADAATKSVAVVQNRSIALSGSKIVAFFVDPAAFTISDTNIDNLTARGVTDLYVRVKDEEGSVDTTVLSNVISYAGGKARVHAWISVGRDDAYLASNPTHSSYHFRVGNDCNAHASSSSYYDTRNGFVDLANTSYQTYLNNQINTIEAISGVSGILLDVTRYGAEYYGWGNDLRTALGKTYYNELAAALCAHHGYTYKTDTNGYYVFSGTTTSDLKSFSTLMNANGAAAKKFIEYRNSVVTNFVKSVKTNLKSGLTLATTIQPEILDYDTYGISNAGTATYGQSPAAIAPYVDYVVVLAYFGDYYSHTDNTYVMDWSAKCAAAIAKQGCNVVPAVQANVISNTDKEYADGGRNGCFTTGYEVRSNLEYINDQRRTINGDPTIAGDILGMAIRRAGSAALAKVTFDTTNQVLTFNITAGNTAIKSIRLRLYNNFYVRKSACTVSGTSYTYNGVTWTASGTATNDHYYQLTASISIAAYGTKTIKIPVSTSDGANISPNYNNNYSFVLAAWNSTTMNNSTCLPVVNETFINSAHTTCSFKKTTPQPATCLEAGYNLYTCSTCGYDYAEYVAKLSHSYTTTVTAPTCTEQGYTTTACVNGCGSKTLSDYVAALGHKYTASVTRPTCTTDGYTTYTCSTCKDSYTSDKTLALGHSYTPSVTKPTCTTDGYTTYTCDECGHNYTANQVPALEHNYEGKIVINPSCTEEGAITYTCRACNDSYTDVLPTTEHDYKTDVTAPTCTEEGYTEYTCRICGDNFLDDYVDPLGHNYNVVVTAPTCTEGGYSTYTCICGSNYVGDETEPTGHNYVRTRVASTCTEAGYSLFSCTCGDSYKASYTPVLGHDFLYTDNGSNHITTCSRCDYRREEAHIVEDMYCTLCNALQCDHAKTSAIVLTAATCTEAGLQKIVCDICESELRTEPIAATGHKLSLIAAKKATCTENGCRQHWKCDYCDSRYADETGEHAIPESYITIAASGHKYAATTTDATCTAPGGILYTCTVCNDSYTVESTPALGHSYKADVTKPTCEKAGYTTYTCTKCNDTYTGDEVAATGHKYESSVSDPTCTMPGYTLNICANCGDTTVTDEIDAFGHDFKAEVTDPTCTMPGYTMNTCRICGEINITDEVDALGHDNTVEVVAPTCTMPGYTISVCNICFEVNITDEVDALGHNYETTVTPATCTTDGKITYHCICGNSYTTPGDAALGHSYTYTNNGENHSIGCANCDLNETAAHNYIDGTCLCGAKDGSAPEIEVLPALNVTPNISIGAEIQVMYTILARNLTAYESFYLEVSKTVAGGDPIVTTYGLGEDMVKLEEVKAGANVVAYRAIYTGIGAKNIGDEFTTTLYAITADGAIKCGQANTTSIKSYLTGKITDAASSAVLKTLAVDMLNYGAAAQVNFDYDAENLVNADLTEEQKALGTQTEAAATDMQTISGTGAAITASVSVQNKVFMYLTVRYAATDASKVKFIIKDSEGKIITELIPTALAGGKVFQASYDGVGAKQMREPITIEMQEDGVTVSQSLTWSVESYVAQTRASSATGENLMNMVNALLIYGDSAAAYLA